MEDNIIFLSNYFSFYFIIYDDLMVYLDEYSIYLHLLNTFLSNISSSPTHITSILMKQSFYLHEIKYEFYYSMSEIKSIYSILQESNYLIIIIILVLLTSISSKLYPSNYRNYESM